MTRLIDADELNEYIGRESLDTREKIFALVDRMPTLPSPCGKPCAFERPRGEWEALGFQQGYAFCRCSNCHKTMRLYRDSKNEFCCIADIRKKVVSCMYCGADMRKEGEAE